MVEPAPPVPIPRRHILGVRVDDAGWEEAMTALDAFAVSSEAHHVVTPNPEFVMRARADAGFRAVLEAADLAPADGIGLRWAGRLLREPIRAVVPGSELVWRMAERGAARGERWFLLGAAEGVAAAAGEVLAARCPGLRIAGAFAGTPRDEDAETICRLIEAAAPVQVLLVAYGAPAQELWIARHQPRLRIPVAMGIGGAFNFVSGRSLAPPVWVKRLGLIWLFRLVTEPWRWRRQLTLVAFVRLVIGDAVRLRVRGGSDAVRRTYRAD